MKMNPQYPNAGVPKARCRSRPEIPDLLTGSRMVRNMIEILERAYAISGGASSIETRPPWMRPHSTRDVAARMAACLLMRRSATVIYMALGECGMHAALRVLSLVASFDRTGIDVPLMRPEDFEPCTEVITRMVATGFMIADKPMRQGTARHWVRCIVMEHRPEVLIVDDPDVETADDPQNTAETNRWRVRRELHEAAKGLPVILLMPG